MGSSCSCCKSKKPKIAAPDPLQGGEGANTGDMDKVASVIAEADDGGVEFVMPEAVQVKEQEEKHDAALEAGDSAVPETAEDRRKKMLQGYSTLHSAAGAGNMEVLEGAIDSGDFDIEDTRKDGQTPLLIASKEGQLKTVELLIKKKANLEAMKLPPKKGDAAPDPAQASGHTPLHFAAFNKHIPVVVALLKGKANVEAKANGGTPIIWATASANHDMMMCLADGGADLNTLMTKENNEAWAPIHLATKSADMKAIQILAMKKANLEIQLNNGSTPLAMAGMMEKLDVAKALLDMKANVEAKAEDVPLLLRAAHAGQTDFIKLLVNYKADVNYATPEGMTATHVATKLKSSEALSVLIEGKADLEKKDEEKLTPFLLAVLYNHEEQAKLLIEKKADVTAKFTKGDTPAHIAASQGFDSLVKLLVESDCSVSDVNDAGQTALHVICASIEKRDYATNEKMILTLCEAKADTTIKLPGEGGLGGKTALGLLRKSNDKEGSKDLQNAMKKYCPAEFTFMARAAAAAEEMQEKAQKMLDDKKNKGPTYKEGDTVEVWSNSNQQWFEGKVTKVENGIVSTNFDVPGKGNSSKDIPATNTKELRKKE